MRAAPTLDARALAALYDEGYFHGVGSGYPASGYESEHASWRHWVAHLGRGGAGRRWLDLGCAYGYLVAEAAEGGFRAAGVDVSAYALARAGREISGAGGRMARGLLEMLPIRDASVDVVSAFDVLEHLVDPDAALAETRRVLRPGGVLIGATPDPRFFDREEETHVAEHPPAWWIERLLALGFRVDFRFFQAPYNLELLATLGAPGLAPAARLRPEGFAEGADLGAVEGEEAGRIAVRLRAGFGSAGSAHPAPVRWLEAGTALAYVLVTGRAPVAVVARLEARAADGAAELTLALDDQRVGRVRLETTWRALATEGVPLAAGGHHLRVQASAPALVRCLVVTATPVARPTLLARLPFDMYQRYDQCRAVVARLPGGSPRILDVGGTLGGVGGHLATTGDFFPDGPPPVSVDVRPSDEADHHAAPPGALPFADASFDVIVCQDVLEHLARAERPRLLDELGRVARRFVLLGAPFATPGVAAADRALFALILARHGYAHRFLDEHLRHGHPDLETTVAHFTARGASVSVLPNGHLPYWTLMQALNLRLAEPVMGARYAAAQARYNGHVRDWRPPAYRHLLVIDLTGERGWRAEVEALVHASDPATSEQDAAALSAVLDLAVAPPAVADAGDERAPRAADEGADAAVPRAAEDAPRRDQALALGADERARLAALERFAARVRDHPAYRLYGTLRRLWRTLAGGPGGDDAPDTSRRER